MHNKDLKALFVKNLAAILEDGTVNPKTGEVMPAGAAYYSVALTYLDKVGALVTDEKPSIAAKLKELSLPFPAAEDVEELRH